MRRRKDKQGGVLRWLSFTTIDGKKKWRKIDPPILLLNNWVAVTENVNYNTSVCLYYARSGENNK